MRPWRGAISGEAPSGAQPLHEDGTAGLGGTRTTRTWLPGLRRPRRVAICYVATPDTGRRLPTGKASHRVVGADPRLPRCCTDIPISPPAIVASPRDARALGTHHATSAASARRHARIAALHL